MEALVGLILIALCLYALAMLVVAMGMFAAYATYGLLGVVTAISVGLFTWRYIVHRRRDYGYKFRHAEADFRSLGVSLAVVLAVFWAIAWSVRNPEFWEKVSSFCWR